MYSISQILVFKYFQVVVFMLTVPFILGHPGSGKECTLVRSPTDTGQCFLEPECNQVCNTTNEQQCTTENRQECNTVNEQKCTTEQKQQCTNVPEQKCSNVNEQQCKTVNREECTQVSTRI